MKSTFSGLLAAVVITLPVGAHAGLFGPDNYEECMLDKMKGQNSSMYTTAHKACAKIFKLEQEVFYPIKKEWVYNSGSITITIIENPTDYNFTRGQFSFSSKECSISQDSDFGEAKDIAFTSGKRVAMFIYPPPMCMKTIKLWGQYK